MIICLESSVLGGYLSNEIPGLVTGLLHLAGRSKPVRVELEGNFLRDMAGCRVDFHNPCPEADPDLIAAIEPIQNGHCGIMTGSYRVARLPRRRHVKTSADVNMTILQDPPGLKNLVFFEWFNEQKQRVLMQSWHLQLRVSSPRWTLDKEEESKLLRTNRARRRAFLLERARLRRQQSDPGTDPFADSSPPTDRARFDPDTDPFSTDLSFPLEPHPPRSKRSRPQGEPLPDPFQRAESLAAELRQFEQLLLVQDDVASRPAMLRLLSTVGDLAAHLGHALRQFVTSQRRDFEFLTVDLEQSLPLFGAALNATEEMADRSTLGPANRWLQNVQSSLLSIELSMRELLALLR